MCCLTYTVAVTPKVHPKNRLLVSRGGIFNNSTETIEITMPLAPRHKEQRSKNFTLLVILVALVAVLFVLTMMKISGAL